MGSNGRMSWSPFRAQTQSHSSRNKLGFSDYSSTFTSSSSSSSFAERQYHGRDLSPRHSPKHSPLRELNRDDKYMYGGSRSPEPYVPEEKKTKFDYSPQFTVTLRPRVVIEGATARFSCSVTGIPNPDVTWSRGPVQLDNAGRFISVNNHGLLSLEIVGVSRDDAGLYTCEATNEHGKASCCASLEIQETEYEEGGNKYKKPRFVQSVTPETINAELGDRITLLTHVIGYPSPSFKWLRDGKDLVGTFRFRSSSDEEGRAELVILDARPEDTGLYHCIASNKFGSCSTYANVNVSKGTKTTTDTESDPPKKDFTYVNQMALSDDGSSPWFLKNLPSSVSLEEGEPLVLECIVSGDPPPVVTWKKGSRTLRYGSRHRVVSDGQRHLLEIPETLATDYGEYTATALSAVGTLVSKTTYVDVTPKSGKLEKFSLLEDTEFENAIKARAPHFIAELPDTIEVAKDEKLRLHCNTKGSYDAVGDEDLYTRSRSYRHKREEVITTEMTTDGGVGAPVFIKTLLPDVLAELGSSTEFRCNYHGDEESEITTISSGKEFAPMFIKPLNTMVAKPGDSIQIQCHAATSM